MSKITIHRAVETKNQGFSMDF